ncbi:hypothetical protein RchiOBHm_Chr4g0388771 [Rosa chinensis]|uniref:Uncharacterized protein n=1 Tax=Rosa chinensis TaxID=74649 RepID=A0A2P6QPT9_ROSCH|nr:hypothetical protein RchiOBHm_Chr4g0388771 [Rosa chinensis]
MKFGFRLSNFEDLTVGSPFNFDPTVRSSFIYIFEFLVKLRSCLIR